MASNILVLNGDSVENDYIRLFELDEGDIFKVESDYETVMMRIEEYKPNGIDFEVFPINPGTDQYMLVGPDHCMVVKKVIY